MKNKIKIALVALVLIGLFVAANWYSYTACLERDICPEQTSYVIPLS